MKREKLLVPKFGKVLKNMHVERYKCNVTKLNYNMGQ
jgi:hypothetical protein